jgi:hypothetical protein
MYPDDDTRAVSIAAFSSDVDDVVLQVSKVFDYNGAISNATSHVPFPIYGGGFFFAPTNTYSSSCQENDVRDMIGRLDPGLDCLTAVVFYNLALCTHCQALHDGSSALFHQALHLYERSYEAVETLLEDEDLFHMRSDWALFALALYNNMGHINFFFFRKARAAWCLRKLRCTLKVVNRQSSFTDEYLFFYQTFLVNCNLSNIMKLASSA